MPDDRYACPKCTRTDLSLTVNGRLRSHTANGKRRSDDNPNCGGGSGWPKHDHRYNTPDPDPTFEDAPPLCDVCGEPDPRPTQKEVDNALYVGTAGGDVPDEVEAEADHVMQRAADHGIRKEPAVTTADDPNPSLQRGAALARQMIEQKPPSADDLLDEDPPEADADAPPYFAARYDGSCDTCGADFAEGDMIRKAPGGGWEAEECCGREIDEAAEQRPKSTAPQLPVVNGRYKGPHPDTGKTSSWTRSTTFAEAISDSYALTLWQLRMAGMGLVKRPDLAEKIRSCLQANGGVPYEVAKLQREYLNTIMENAKLAAGSKDRARKGTILHKHTQEIDMGRKTPEEVPREFRTSVNAYLAAMEADGFSCIPDLIERSTLCTTFGVAGTFDRILRVEEDLDEVELDDGRRVQLRKGDHVIGDVKSGQDLTYAWLEILIQLAIYAHGVTEAGVAVPDRGPQGTPTWRWADLAEFGIDNLRTDVAIVMHVPYGEDYADLYYADLITGWRGAKICKTNIDYRNTKSPMTPVRRVRAPKAKPAFDPAGSQPVADVRLPAAPTPDMKTDQPPVAGEGLGKDLRPAPVTARMIISSVPDPVGTDATGKGDVVQPPKPKRSWEDVARNVTTKDEANKVWAEMRKRVAVLGTARINSVVAIMRETLREKGAV